MSWAGAVGTLVMLACCQRSLPDRAAAAAKESPRVEQRSVVVPGDILTSETKLYSLANEELIIRDFFHDRRDDFFLDVGCANPIQNNNTYYLEKHLGWSGIGVDALPEFATAWQRKRPRSKFCNFLVSDHSDTVEPFYRAELRGISAAEKPETNPGGRPAKSEKLYVPTITLTKLLEQNGMSRIAFMSMDIEGAEPRALAGFDIARFKPELACVEAKPPRREKIMAYFTDHGYERIDSYLKYDQVNYYFRPRAAPP